MIDLPRPSEPAGKYSSWSIEARLEGLTGHADLVRLWRYDLALAVADRAVSVHYHPWRADGETSCVVGRNRFEMLPPPFGAGLRYVEAAAALIRPGVWTTLRRWLGLPPRASGRVRLVEPDGSASDWVGVVWAAGGVAGVEWYRLTPVGQAPDAEPATSRSGLAGMGQS